MTVFTFDKVEDYVQESSGASNKINFLKIPDHGDMAKVRFMYGAGETFTGYSVHSVKSDTGKNKNVLCLREPGQELDVCPLCKAGSKINVQYYIPVYVISLTTKVNGMVQEQPVNGVYLFQRGKSFNAMISSVIRQCGNTPIVSNVFNIVRNGVAGSKETTYVVEFVDRDTLTIDKLPPRPEVLGTYILPNLTAEQMIEKYINPSVNPAQEVTPRTIQTNTPNVQQFGGIPSTPPKFSF